MRYSRNTLYKLSRPRGEARVRSGAQRRIGGGTGAIYDVSKTSIRRSLTPIVAFHAVRVSLPKLYCRKVDLTRAGFSPRRPRSSFSCCYRGGVTAGVVTSARGVPARGCPSQDLASRLVPVRHLLLLLLLLVLFSRFLASPRARNACRCSRYTVRVVNACIFLN